MNFTYENQGTNTYLVYEAKDNIDTMSLGMLTNNKIPGLAPVLFTQMDTTRYIKYNVSAHVSAKQFFSGPVNKKRLIGVFNGIVDAMLSAEDYMIDINTILLDLDYIFADVSTCETVLICMPVICEDSQTTDLGAFFKNIMFSTQFDQTENCDHVAKIMNYLNSTPVFSLVDFKELLNDIDAQKDRQTAMPKQQLVVTQSVQTQSVLRQPIQSQPVVQAPKVEQPKAVPVQSTIVKPIPVASASPVQVPAVQPNIENPNTPEKKMTVLNLLMHYSKENVAIYKAQKEATKGSKTTTDTKNKKQKKAKVSTPVTNTDFAILGQTVMPVAPAVSANQSQNVPVQNGVPVASVSKNVVVNTPPTVPQGKAMNFGETTVLGGENIGETTVLSVAPTVAQPNPHLIRCKNNDKINLDKPVFRIGKEKSYVDYFINDNTAVSRSHANIICRDSQYFVMDTNSKNHTYVNGTMIQSNAETKLEHNDKIRFANEDFEFKLY